MIVERKSRKVSRRESGHHGTFNKIQVESQPILKHAYRTVRSQVVAVSTSRALTSLIRRGPDSTCTVFFTQVSPSSDHLICVLVTAGWAMEVAFSYVFAFKSFFSVPFGSSFFAGGSAGFFSLCSSFVGVFFIS